MLRTGQQVAIDHPALKSDVSRQEQIAIKLPVGMGYHLLLAIGVVHCESVDVHGDVAGIDGS